MFIDGYEKREHILADICRTLRVQNAKGELRRSSSRARDLADAVLRLAQACVRVADLYYVQSFRAQSGFREIFADFLQPGTAGPHRGIYHSRVSSGGGSRRISTRAKSSGVGNLIITLSSANETSSHSVANDVFCRWYDLERYRDTFRFPDGGGFQQQDVPPGGPRPRRQPVAGARLIRRTPSLARECWRPGDR